MYQKVNKWPKIRTVSRIIGLRFGIFAGWISCRDAIRAVYAGARRIDRQETTVLSDPGVSSLAISVGQAQEKSIGSIRLPQPSEKLAECRAGPAAGKVKRGGLKGYLPAASP